jgi:gluconolactonase
MFAAASAEFSVIATGLAYPEGPVCLPDGSVAVVEVKGGNLVRFAQSAGAWTEVQRIPLGLSPNGAALGPDGLLWVANSGGYNFLPLGLPPDSKEWTLNIPTTGATSQPAGCIQKVDLQSGAVTTFCATGSPGGGQLLRAPDDLVFDAAGGLWFTDYGRLIGGAREVTGVFYLPAGSSQPQRKLDNRTSPNGIGLSPDGSRLYVAETQSRWIMSWELDPAKTGSIVDPKCTLDKAIPLAPMPNFAQPDSLALDEEGNIYVASMVVDGLNPFTPGGITVFSPNGEQLDYISIDTPIPDPLPSNICFGGPERKTAFITLGGTGQLVTRRMPIAGLRKHFA